ncbi:MAG TPA: SDR family oxidoreductase [Polyangiaceae bacterium]|nr:SDR family oxidoreductase [Polyangiaceae bacterium]
MRPNNETNAGRGAPEGRSKGEGEVKADHGETSYRGSGRLAGRAALITGGDSGIGRAAAIAFAREGADVVIAYHASDDDAQDTLRLIEAEGRRGAALQTDLADPRACRELVARAVEALGGRLDVLVNNAAYQGKAVDSFEQIDEERLERTFKTNVLGTFHVTRAALAHLKPGASIINVTSIQAYHPTPSIVDYSSTKGALTTFTHGLAKELGPKGIRVNAIAPGPVVTPLVAKSMGQEALGTFGGSTVLKRPAQPAELAPAFVYLASDESRFVVGEVLRVTGGEGL